MRLAAERLGARHRLEDDLRLVVAIGGVGAGLVLPRRLVLGGEVLQRRRRIVGRRLERDDGAGGDSSGPAAVMKSGMKAGSRGEEGRLHARAQRICFRNSATAGHRAAVVDDVGIVGLELGDQRREIDVGGGDAGIGGDLAAALLELGLEDVGDALAEGLLVVDDGGGLGLERRRCA